MASVSKLAVMGLEIIASVAGLSAASAQERRDASRDDQSDLSGEVSVSAVAASDRGDDEDEAARSGLILRGGLDYERETSAGEFRLSYDSAAYLYEDDDRPDRWSNRLALRYGGEVADDFRLSARIAYATNLATLEFRSADQAEVLTMAEYSPGDHRFRLTGGWRWRDYDDSTGSESSGPFAGAEYRYRIARDQFFSTELRYEDIDSDDLRRGYHRTILEAFYQHPLGPETQLRVGGSARWWTFDDRLAPNGERRSDSVLAPELQLLHDFRSGLLLRGRLQYGLRESNDPAEDGDDRRATLTAGYRF
ncbi:MAG TPA: hypothetical protein VGB62_05795 [Allosphingosinicella sp.]|jgi:hypothetical protein